MEELSGEIGVSGARPVVHDIRKEEESVVFCSYAINIFSYFLDPFIKYLLEIVGGDLGTDDIAFFDSIFHSLDELTLIVLDVERDKIRPDIGRDGVESFLGIAARRLSPFDGLFLEK